MDLRVRGDGPAAPFLSARELFETEFELEHPVTVSIRSDPDERTRVGHSDSEHVLVISEQAATSAMARELALHEYAHMRRFEEGHASHLLDTDEVLFLTFAGRRLERRVIAQCYQIANHARDVYADDITLSVGPTAKLVAFLESELAAALADRPAPGRGHRITPRSDPAITAVNAAFAVALLERHDAIDPDHRIYDLAAATATDAPEIDFAAFTDGFRSLPQDPDESQHRRALVDLLGRYVDSQDGREAPAAD